MVTRAQISRRVTQLETHLIKTVWRKALRRKVTGSRSGFQSSGSSGET
jgi:hypothetical protein